MKASDTDVKRPENQGIGKEIIYQSRPTADRAVDLLTAYKWPLVGIAALIVSAVALGVVRLPSLSVPDPVISFVTYAILGGWLCLPLAYYLHRKLYNSVGVDVLDLGPASSDHRYVRIGDEVWSDLTITTPWGEEVGSSELTNCTINGRRGYVLQDLRIEDGELTATATHLGNLSTPKMRAYRRSLDYVQNRLSRRANRYTMLRENFSAAVQEAVEKVAYRQYRTVEENAVPEGELIDETLSDILGDVDLDAEPGVSESRENGHKSNGHDDIEDMNLSEALDEMDRRVEQ
jgi:hypothetical protein